MNFVIDNIYAYTFFTGLSCAVSCGFGVVFLLSAWIIASNSNVWHGLKMVFIFFMGKSVIYVLLGVFSSVFGKVLFERGQNLLGFNASLIYKIFLFFIGIRMLKVLFFNNGCRNCKCSVKSVKKDDFSINTKSAFLSGFFYGITPCLPLYTHMLNCTRVDAFGALVLGIIFAVSSMLNPALLLGMFAGKLSLDMRKEILGNVRIVQVFVAMLLIGAVIVL